MVRSLVAALCLAAALPVTAHARAAHQPGQADCGMPAPAEGDQVVLFSAGGGTRQANVSLAGDNADVTHVADVVVEPGERGLYVVLVSYNSMLWRFTGAVDRVQRVVTSSIRREDNSGAGIGGTGVTGIPRDRFASLASWNCLPTFGALGSVDEAMARGKLSDLIGRQPDLKGAAGAVETLRLPSMAVDGGRQVPPWQDMPVVAVDSDRVASAIPAKRYGVMPGRAGLKQLVEEGFLERIPGGNGEGDYRIVRTFERFPTGMTGGIQPRFLLGAGVKMPGGQTGWACVISEETGKPVTDGPFSHCR